MLVIPEADIHLQRAVIYDDSGLVLDVELMVSLSNSR